MSSSLCDAPWHDFLALKSCLRMRSRRRRGEERNFAVPKELQSVPGSNVAKDKKYDQIAFSSVALSRSHGQVRWRSRLQSIDTSSKQFEVSKPGGHAVRRAQLNMTGVA